MIQNKLKALSYSYVVIATLSISHQSHNTNVIMSHRYLLNLITKHNKTLV